MLRRFVYSAIFSLSAMLPIIIFGFSSKMNNPITMAIYLINPAICAFISAYIFSPKICFDPERKANGLIHALLISIIIVMVSLILWTIPAAIMFKPNERTLAPAIALLAGTMYGWGTYPPGLVAGFIVWFITIFNKAKQKDAH